MSRVPEIYVTAHSKPRLVQMMDQNGGKFERSQNFCFSEVHWVIYRIR